MDYEYKKSGPIFNAHSYWTKQPTDIIRNFIIENTKKGDIVLDPFCGSGMTGVAAIQTQRKFILSDISPICVHIAKGYCNKIQTEKIMEEAKKLLSSISHLYVTKCPNCGELVQFDYCILEDELEKNKKLKFDKIVFHCKCQREKFVKTPDDADFELFNSNEYENKFYPQDDFFGNEPKRNFKRGIKKVFQMYSKRNLSALAILKEKIDEIADLSLKQTFLFVFTSILFNCSLMSRYNPKYENTQIKMGSFYIPKLIKDNNVAMSFLRKVKSIIKANDTIFNNSCTNKGVIKNCNAAELNFIDDNSIDYIYTDPPYSDKISYSELNIVYESWLGNGLTDTKNEMIVSKSSGKTISNYSAMFRRFMGEAYRVLKENKKITIIFHNSNIEHWSFFQKTVNYDGFRPVCNKCPDRMISAAKTSTQYQSKNDSQCFLVFNFIKDSKYRSENRLKTLSDKEYTKLIDDLKKEALNNGYKNKCDQFDYVINRLLFNYQIKDYIPI